MLKSRCFERERLQPLRKRHGISVALATEGMLWTQGDFFRTLFSPGVFSSNVMNQLFQHQFVHLFPFSQSFPLLQLLLR